MYLLCGPASDSALLALSVSSCGTTGMKVHSSMMHGKGSRVSMLPVSQGVIPVSPPRLGGRTSQDLQLKE